MQRTKSSTLVKKSKKNELKPALVAKTMARQETSTTASLQKAGSTAGMHHAVKPDAAPSAAKTGEKTDANDLLCQENVKRLIARVKQADQEMESKWMVPQDRKTKFRATILRKEGKTDAHSTASTKDGRMDSAPTELKRDENAAANPPSAEKVLLSERELKLTKMLFSVLGNDIRQLFRDLEFLERIERKEKKLLEDADWYMWLSAREIEDREH